MAGRKFTKRKTHVAKCFCVKSRGKPEYCFRAKNKAKAHAKKLRARGIRVRVRRSTCDEK